MKHIRNRIIELLDAHEGTFYDCKGCDTCTEIQSLGSQLNRDSAEKFQHILAKGQDMTRSDIAFLLENDVTVAAIRKAVGIGNTDFSKMLINYGFSYKRKGTEKMAKITLEEYQDLKAIGKADKEIALDKGMNIQYLSQLKKKWDIRPALSSTAELKPSETKPTQEDKTAEYESLQKRIELFKKEMNEKNDYILDLQNKVSELENLHAACEDVENELAGLREENARLVKQGHHNSYIISNQKYQLEKWAMENEALEEENKALKYFAKKYLA